MVNIPTPQEILDTLAAVHQQELESFIEIIVNMIRDQASALVTGRGYISIALDRTHPKMTWFKNNMSEIVELFEKQGWFVEIGDGYQGSHIMWLDGEMRLYPRKPKDKYEAVLNGEAVE